MKRTISFSGPPGNFGFSFNANKAIEAGGNKNNQEEKAHSGNKVNTNV